MKSSLFSAVCSKMQTVCQRRWRLSCCPPWTDRPDREQRGRVSGMRKRRSREEEERTVTPSVFPAGILARGHTLTGWWWYKLCMQNFTAKLYNKTHELIVKYVHFTVMCDTQLWLAHICNVPGFSLFCICGKKRILPETMSQIEIITNALLTNFSISTYFCSLMRFSHQHRIK